MNPPPSRPSRVVWGVSGLVILAVAAGFYLHSPEHAERPLPVLGQIPDFHLTNENGQVISPASLRGKVWVADIIFTRCPGPCRTMTKRMAELQADLAADQPVRLVTLTSDPENDTPAVMKKFAAEFNADTNRWWFLTGDRNDLRSLAVNDFKFVVVENKPQDRTVPDDLFIHSTWFALVDREGRMRGWFDEEGHEHATFKSEEEGDMKDLRGAIKQLLLEGT